MKNNIFFYQKRVKPESIKDTDLTSGWEVHPTDRPSPGYSNGPKCNSPYPCRWPEKCDLVSHGKWIELEMWWHPKLFLLPLDHKLPVKNNIWDREQLWYVYFAFSNSDLSFWKRTITVKFLKKVLHMSESDFINKSQGRSRENS